MSCDVMLSEGDFNSRIKQKVVLGSMEQNHTPFGQNLRCWGPFGAGC